MPPPGPCDASAKSVDDMQAMIANAVRDIEAFMRNDVMTIPCKEDTTILYATFAAMNPARLPRVILKILIRRRSSLMKRMIGAAVVAGALAFTGSAAVNPALTIAAQALRSAEHIRREDLRA